MGTSPLLGGQRTPQRPAGSGTDALGPSDSSDTGSDIRGADGAVDTAGSGLDADDTRRAPGAGADIGDANLDSDSDRSGTGERAEAGRDTVQREAPDIAPDEVQAHPEASVRDVDERASDGRDPGRPERDAQARRGSARTTRRR